MIDGLTKEVVKQQVDGKLNQAGDFVDLVGDSGKIWGAALRSTKESTKPIYVSIGHRVSLDTALDIVKLTIRGVRIPEPIRQADLKGREKIRELYDH